jgi:hypothetical protein
MKTDSKDRGRLHTPMVMCQLCFEGKTRAELAPVEDEPGMVWDVCIPCRTLDKEMAERKEAGELDI